MIIYFLRHASAGEKRTNPRQDEKRPLDKQGIEQCRSVGAALAVLDVQIDLMISSPLKRATQTAALVANEIGYEGELILDNALRPDASFESFRELMRKHGRYDAIMVVGHNPTLTDFCSLLLTNGIDNRVVELKKAGVAKLEYSGKANAILQWSITPKVVRTLQASTAVKPLPKTARK